MPRDRQPTVEDSSDDEGSANPSMSTPPDTYPQGQNSSSGGDLDPEKTTASSPQDASSSDSDHEEEKPETRSLGLNDKQARQRLLATLQNTVPHMGFGADQMVALRKAIDKLAELSMKACNKVKAWKKEHPVLFWLIVLCVVLGISSPIIIHLVGFTAGGIAAGSIAAGIHSAIGNVVVGSLFAGLQSAAATGLLTAGCLGFAAVAPVALVAFVKALGNERLRGWVGNCTQWFMSWFKS